MLKLSRGGGAGGGDEERQRAQQLNQDKTHPEHQVVINGHVQLVRRRALRTLRRIFSPPACGGRGECIGLWRRL